MKTPTWLALVMISAPAFAGEGAAVEEAKLLASDGMLLAGFGSSAAVDGDTLVIGAPDDFHSGLIRPGSAYVFVNGPSGWQEQAKLVHPAPWPDSDFGEAVAIEGDTLVIGSPTYEKVGSYVGTGIVNVFVRSGTTWTHEQKILPNDVKGGMLFGGQIALEQSRLLVGAVGARGITNGTGAAYLFEREDGEWTQTAKLFRGDGIPSDNFGLAVALSGETALITDGTDTVEGLLAGSATFFEEVGGAWLEGPTFFNPSPQTFPSFGRRAALDGDVGVIGAPGQDTALGVNAGAAYVFERDVSGWSLVQTLQGFGAIQQERFGDALALEGTRIVVGSPLDFVPGNASGGSVYRFEHVGGQWEQQEYLSEDTGSFGSAVGISGDVLVAGARGDDELGSGAGAAWVLRTAPYRTPYCTAGTSAGGCRALISASGLPSATAATGFHLNVASVEGQKDGLFFWGTSGRQANPWSSSSSFQCVVPPTRRGPVLAGTGTALACDGSASLDLNARWTTQPAQNPGPGAVVQAQFWYRDPAAPTAAKTSLSDAIEFTVCP